MKRDREGAGKQGAGASQSGRPLVRSVERTARIMEALFLAPDGTHLSDVSRELGLHKTSVLRTLRTLVALRVVERDGATELYRWSPLVWLRMADRLRHLWARVDAVQQLLAELAQATGETVALGVPDMAQREIMLVGCELARKPVVVDPRVVPCLPMHALAAGKCYLGGLTEAELRAWMAVGLPAMTEHTITSPERLAAEVARVRQQGYAVSRQEGLLGACGLAVPLVDGQGRLAGAVGLTAPEWRFTEEDVQGWVPLLRAASDEISLHLYALGEAPSEKRTRVLQGASGGGQRDSVAPGETLLQHAHRPI